MILVLSVATVARSLAWHPVRVDTLTFCYLGAQAARPPGSLTPWVQWIAHIGPFGRLVTGLLIYNGDLKSVLKPPRPGVGDLFVVGMDS